MANEITIIKTADGSSSLFIPSLDETYHSRHGAINEAKHVFISKGLKLAFSLKNDIRIFEMGFGTGLNCLLSAIELSDHPQKTIEYTGLEKHPLDWKILGELSYRELDSVLHEKIHRSKWDAFEKIKDGFHLRKTEDDLFFDVTIDQDDLSFDYKLRKGICQNMNATFLMKSMGIID